LELVACSGTAGVDIAEWYPVRADIAAADLVVASATDTVSYQESVFDPKTQDDTGVKNTVTVPVLEKSSVAYGDILGVVSTNPAVTYGHELNDAATSTAPIAVTGRVPVKVSDVNGAIKAGDAIAASDLPGVGMRATKPGMIVGYALGAWAGPGVGTVLVNVNVGWSAGGTINSDGVFTFLDDSMVLNSAVAATNLITTSNSYGLAFRGSAWDSASSTAVTRDFTILNKVEGPNNYRLAFNDDSGNELASLSQNGNLAISGSLTAANDEGYAEMFSAASDLEAGDLVMADDSATSTTGVARADAPYENALLGVIATSPGVTIGSGDKPVTLTGRLPAKVSNAGGAIKIGDPITSSDTPGVGMKATEAGRVVGIALENYDGSGTGLIKVFVNPSWYNGPAAVAGATAGSGLTVTEGGLMDFKSSTLSGLGGLLGADGSWSVTADGHLVAATVEAKTVTTDALVIRQSADSQTTGEGTIPGGSNAIVIQNPAVHANSRVFVTFEGNPGGGWWVAEKGEGNFTIHLTAVAPAELPFQYWIMNVEDTRASLIPAGSSPATDSGTPTDSGSSTLPTDSGTSTSPTDSATTTP
jgi:hypothetical protein